MEEYWRSRYSGVQGRRTSRVTQRRIMRDYVIREGERS